MKCNIAGKDLIKSFEQLRLQAYQDAVGVWTIGYGHIDDVKEGQTISEHQADVIFDFDLSKVEERLSEHCPSFATSNQFSACVSLAFNVGVERVLASTLFRRFKMGDVETAADEFVKWDHAGGRELEGLKRRRLAERQLFETPDDT